MDDVIDPCRAWIEAALEHGGNTHTFEDVKQGILEGRMQLWPAEDGCCVTEIVVYPRKKVLSGFLAGGDLSRVIDMIPDIEAWAVAHGCAAAEITGRRGWVRAFGPIGYREAATNIRKELA